MKPEHSRAPVIANEGVQSLSVGFICNDEAVECLAKVRFAQFAEVSIPKLDVSAQRSNLAVNNSQPK